MTRKQILAMNYGSIEQMVSADKWLSAFAMWCDKKADSWCSIDRAWHKVLLDDVFYQANRRRIEFN